MIQKKIQNAFKTFLTLGFSQHMFTSTHLPRAASLESTKNFRVRFLTLLLKIFILKQQDHVTSNEVGIFFAL